MVQTCPISFYQIESCRTVCVSLDIASTLQRLSFLNLSSSPQSPETSLATTSPATFYSQTFLKLDFKVRIFPFPLLLLKDLFLDL